jgi:hypothetical protein
LDAYLDDQIIKQSKKVTREKRKEYLSVEEQEMVIIRGF